MLVSIYMLYFWEYYTFYILDPVCTNATEVQKLHVQVLDNILSILSNDEWHKLVLQHCKQVCKHGKQCITVCGCQRETLTNNNRQ